MKRNAKPALVVTANFSSKSEDELILFRIQLEKEFKKRGIKFSVAEVGETLAIKHFISTPGLPNLQRAPIGTKNVDALSRDGERYSIKSIKDGNKTGTVYPDRIEKDKQLFEYLLLVYIDDDFELSSLHRFNWKQFCNVRMWDKTMNAWYIPKTKKALNESELIYEKTEKK